MKGEIDRDWYCGGASDLCTHYPFCPSCCDSRHRKWPTPEQYRKKYGEEYPDDAAVYCQISNIDDSDVWGVGEYIFYKNEAKKMEHHYHTFTIVCACTPFGCPPADWRPL